MLLSTLRSLGALKAMAIGAVFVGSFLLVVAAVDPRSALRRSLNAQITALDEQLVVLRRRRRGRFVVCLQGVALLVVLALAVQLALPQLLPLAVLVAAAPKISLRALVAARQQAIQDQVHGFALHLANAMRSTANIGDAVRIAAKVTGGPLGEELDTTLAQMSVGGSLEEVLEDLASRTRVLALEVLVGALLIGRRTGGDLPRLMEATAGSLREIHRLEAFAVKALSDVKRGFVFLAATLPVGFVGLKQLMPMVVDPFLGTPQGQRTLACCVAAYGLCLVLGWKLVRVDV